MSNPWLTSLIAADAQAGWDLAVKLSRMGVTVTQPNDDVRARLRDVYANDAQSLTEASKLIAVNFQTVAAANSYWRDA